MKFSKTVLEESQSILERTQLILVIYFFHKLRLKVKVKMLMCPKDILSGTPNGSPTQGFKLEQEWALNVNYDNSYERPSESGCRNIEGRHKT